MYDVISWFLDAQSGIPGFAGAHRAGRRRNLNLNINSLIKWVHLFINLFDLLERVFMYGCHLLYSVDNYVISPCPHIMLYVYVLLVIHN